MQDVLKLEVQAWLRHVQCFRASIPKEEDQFAVIKKEPEVLGCQGSSKTEDVSICWHYFDYLI